MTNRRDVLKAGTALPALALVGAPFASALGAAAASLELERFVFDVRFAESGAIAEHVGHLGVPLAPIADDLMTLWYDDLDLKWKNAPMAIGGVTMIEALFILETFAADRGMRLVYRGDHSAYVDGRMHHVLNGPAEMLGGLAPVPKDAAWVPALADLLAQCPQQSMERSSLEFETAGERRIVGDDREALARRGRQLRLEPLHVGAERAGAGGQAREYQRDGGQLKGAPQTLLRCGHHKILPVWVTRSVVVAPSLMLDAMLSADEGVVKNTP